MSGDAERIGLLLTKAGEGLVAANELLLSGAAVKEKKEKPRPGFLEIYEARLERRRLEQRREDEKRAAVDTDVNQLLPDYSMQKLFQSILIRLGGTAPVITPGNRNASTITLHALQARRFGARRPFSQDSGPFSMPQYPFVFENMSGINFSPIED